MAVVSPKFFNVLVKYVEIHSRHSRLIFNYVNSFKLRVVITKPGYIFFYKLIIYKSFSSLCNYFDKLAYSFLKAFMKFSLCQQL